MAAELKIVEEAKAQVGMNPKKFALWLFMVSVIMIFGALTSAYIVRQAEGNWLDFDMPSMFWITSAMILASSVTMHWAYLSAKRDNHEMAKVAMVITVILGTGFLVGQWLGWNELVANGIYLVGRESSGVSGSFLYVISGLHGVHVISGVIFLAVVLVNVFRLKIHSKNLSQIEMCTTYWHFLDGLWLYLFVFLLLNR
ncbi:MAG TPA: cytochrome c oxidase subunit 3 [Chryseosolibacter sp.]